MRSLSSGFMTLAWRGSPRRRRAGAVPTNWAQYATSRGSAEPLHHHRHALPATDAHRLKADRLVVRAQPVEQRRGDARARHSERVAERDRAAVDVELLLIYPQVPGRR